MFIDTHIDTLWAMRGQKRQFHEAKDVGHVDLARAQNSGLVAGFFTGYPSDSNYTTEKMLRDWVIMVNDPKNKMKKIIGYQSFESHIDKWKKADIVDREVGTIMHFEGAAGLDTDLNRLYIYYEAGLRSIGLTWNEENQFATGQEQGENRGVTKEGFDLLSAMQDLGIIIDVSHLNDKSFWDVVNNTNGPIIATHSNFRGLCDHRRNMTSDMIQAIYDCKGSMGVNLYSAFLSTNEKVTKEDAVKMFGKMLELTDTKSVHSGADLDGADFPEGITDITDLPPLFSEIAQEYSLSEQDMKNIQVDNVRRIMKAVWK